MIGFADEHRAINGVEPICRPADRPVNIAKVYRLRLLEEPVLGDQSVPLAAFLNGHASAQRRNRLITEVSWRYSRSRLQSLHTLRDPRAEPELSCSARLGSALFGIPPDHLFRVDDLAKVPLVDSARAQRRLLRLRPCSCAMWAMADALS